MNSKSMLSEFLREVLKEANASGSVDAETLSRFKAWLMQEDESAEVSHFALCSEGPHLYDALKEAQASLLEQKEAVQKALDSAEEALMALSVQDGLLKSGRSKRKGMLTGDFESCLCELDESLGVGDLEGARRVMANFKEYLSEETFSGHLTYMQVHTQAENLYEGLLTVKACLDAGDLRADIVDTVNTLLEEVETGSVDYDE